MSTFCLQSQTTGAHRAGKPLMTPTLFSDGHSRPLVGILGGMGPRASAYFTELIVDLTKAERDCDHVRVLMLNDGTIPDRSSYLCQFDSPSRTQPSRFPRSAINSKEGLPPLPAPVVNPADTLTALAHQLEANGCSFLAMPCNTAHAFEEAIRDAVSIPLLSMIAETAWHCSRLGWQRVGVLCTQGTKTEHLYDRAFGPLHATAIYPDTSVQRGLDHLIAQVKQGVPPESPTLHAALHQAVASLISQGCDGVILGCTELSVVAGRARVQFFTDGTVVDALACLARRVVIASGAPQRDSLYFTPIQRSPLCAAS